MSQQQYRTNRKTKQASKAEKGQKAAGFVNTKNFVRTKPTKGLKTRKAKAPRAATLKQAADQAGAIGIKTAKKIYLQIRLSINAAKMADLFAVSRYFGLTASDTARRALRFNAAASHEERKRLFSKIEARASKINQGRKIKPKTAKKGAAEKWAEACPDKWRKARLLLNVTAADLSDLAAEYEERKAAALGEYTGQGGGRILPPSMSGAFRAAITIYLLIAKGYKAKTEKTSEAARLKAELFGEPKPRPRQNRNRAYTEAKRRIAESGTKSSL